MRKQTLIKILEDNGFDVKIKENGEIEVQQYTPEGEDWWLYFVSIKDFVEYADNYDPEDDFTMWVEARSRDKSVPSIPDLWKDQLWKQDLLLKVAQEIEEKENKQ